MDQSTERGFTLYEEYPSCNNSHDSLLQPVYAEESSTDDLLQLNSFFPSTFHSKDSALDFSEENLPQLFTDSPSSSSTEQTSKAFERELSLPLSPSLHIWTMSSEHSLSVLIGLSTNPVGVRVCVCVHTLFEQFNAFVSNVNVESIPIVLETSHLASIHTKRIRPMFCSTAKRNDELLFLLFLSFVLFFLYDYVFFFDVTFVCPSSCADLWSSRRLADARNSGTNTLLDLIGTIDTERKTNRCRSHHSLDWVMELCLGMYYPAFGSAAALLTTEQHRYEWLAESAPPADPPVRIVHPSETIGDDEDEFYLSPRTCELTSHSCPDLCHLSGVSIRRRAYSLSTLDSYAQTLFTHEVLEQIWHSLLDLAMSECDDYELNDYRLRHILGLSNSYSAIHPSMIEKSRSHNDISSIAPRHQIGRKKSKSFDVTSLIKQFTSNEDPANVGLLQGADVSEPFADRLISASIHSDLESIHSLDQEGPLSETLPSVVTVEPFTYVFNYSPSLEHDDYELNLDEKEETLSDHEELLSSAQINDTYTALSLFRPHSLSTIPSSRASQYASSVDSDDLSERDQDLRRDTPSAHSPFHPSDDDHGVIGSEFSSPRSRPLSSIQSRSLSPDEQQQVSKD